MRESGCLVWSAEGCLHRCGSRLGEECIPDEKTRPRSEAGTPPFRGEERGACKGDQENRKESIGSITPGTEGILPRVVPKQTLPGRREEIWNVLLGLGQ